MTSRSSFAIRFANGLAVCICVAWFIVSPGFEPVVTALMLSAGFLYPLQNDPRAAVPTNASPADSSIPAENQLPAQSGAGEAIAGMSNQPNPALACLEHLRLENIQAPWADMPPMFSAARFIKDGAGVRIGWNVAEVRRGGGGSVHELLDRFMEQHEAVSKQFSLEHHYLALVAFGGSAGENEELASEIEMICRASSGRRGIKVLIGFMAVNRFVDRVLTNA